jgi:hypothetical protein
MAKRQHIQNINPLSEMLGSKTENLYFTYRFFLERPDLFTTSAETLIYINYAGQSIKSGVLYDIFESFIRQSDSEYIAKKMEGKLTLSDYYKYDVSFLITWAKIIRTNHISLQFEPVLEKVRTVMKDWMANRKVYINGHVVDVEIFHPLFYTKNGDSFIDLLPYICYVFTFLIYGAGFSFDEGISEASTFGFLKSIDGYLAAHYANLAQSYDNIEIAKESIQFILQTIPEQALKNFFDHVLSTRAVIGLRNNEINKTPEQLDQNIQSQNGISIDTIRESWSIVMTNLVTIAIKAAPIKELFDKIPQFDRKLIDIDELILLTEYCISGGNSPFIIEENPEGRYSYLFHADPESLKVYPKIIPTQFLHSDILPVTKPIQQPFNENDHILKIIGAYVRQEFARKRNDMFDETPIVITETDLRLTNDNSSLVPSYIDNQKINYTEPHRFNIASTLFNLFINGVWTYDNSSMSEIFLLLANNAKFVREISDILSLSYITQIVWTNRQASVIFSTLCLSYLNKYLLMYVSNGLPLKTFSPMTYLLNMKFNSSINNRIKHLCNMTTALLYIRNKEYARFVNLRVNQIVTMMTYDNLTFMQQVYTKYMNDKAEFWAIGGVELYNFARHANPLVRGYAYNTRCWGNCEALETFYKWIKDIDNTALFSLIEQNKGSISIIYTAIRNYLISVYNFDGLQTKTNDKAQPPKLLANYSFTTEGYSQKTYPYFLDLQTTDEIDILTQVATHSYTANKPNLEASPRVCFREIICSEMTLDIGRLKIGEMNVPTRHGTATVPVSTSTIGKVFHAPAYNYTGHMAELNLSFQIPSHVQVIELILFNSRVSENSTILLFTTAPRIDSYQKYSLDLDNQIDESIIAKSNRVSRKFINNKSIDEIRKESNIGDKYRIETTPASSNGMFNERLLGRPTKMQLAKMKVQQ